MQTKWGYTFLLSLAPVLFFSHSLSVVDSPPCGWRPFSWFGLYWVPFAAASPLPQSFSGILLRQSPLSGTALFVASAQKIPVRKPLTEVSSDLQSVHSVLVGMYAVRRLSINPLSSCTGAPPFF